MRSSRPPRQAQSPRRPNPASATTTVSISASAAAAMSTSYSSPIDNCKNKNKPSSSPPPPSRPHHSPPSSGLRPNPKSRRHSLPFSFPPIFHQNPTTLTSASLVSSTAQGRPIPLDHETTSHRTSALRELNSNYPSRHRYAKSTGAQSTTYSQPVIVRTYSGPPSRPASATRGGRQASSTTSRLRYPFSSASTTQSTPVVRNVGPALLSNSMVRAKHLAQGKKRPGRNDEQPAKLPPVEAFSFKSFMADASMQQDISTDLDRIAEICARSRYSLSNQYEVHVAPHGSGAAFVTSSVPRGNLGAVGPTLQAVSSDDERGHRKRRGAGRRRSVAYGTLETIMSSSRSSEEDRKQKKKSAAEIADEVRGRAARKETTTTPSSSLKNRSPKKATDTRQRRDGSDDAAGRLAKQKSASFATAIIDRSRHHVPAVPLDSGEFTQETASPRNSTAALHSEPALPQTSSSHLEIRTGPDQLNGGATYVHESRPQSPTGSDDILDPLSITASEEPRFPHPVGILSSLGSWMPWGGVKRVGQNGCRNGAEGSLRQLLRSSDSKPTKGKSVERNYHH